MKLVASKCRIVINILVTRPKIEGIHCVDHGRLPAISDATSLYNRIWCTIKCQLQLHLHSFLNCLQCIIIFSIILSKVFVYLLSKLTSCQNYRHVSKLSSKFYDTAVCLLSHFTSTDPFGLRSFQLLRKWNIMRPP